MENGNLDAAGETAAFRTTDPMSFGRNKFGGGKKQRVDKYKGDQTDPHKFGDFERHTSGIGSKVKLFF
jgi:hypothetical protein